MGTRERENRIRIFNLYFIMLIPLVFCSKDLVFSFGKEIAGINSMMNAIAIPCCVIYYKITKKNNVFLYSLFFLSILIDNAYQYFTLYVHSINGSVPLLVIFRNLSVILIIFDFNIVNEWVSKNKTKVFIFVASLNVLLLLTNDIMINLLYNNVFFDRFMGICTVLTVVWVFIRLVKGMKNIEFIEVVFLTSLFLIALRRLVIYIKYAYEINIVEPQALFFLSFYILLMGLFVEVSCVIKENTKLEKEVEIISQDIKEFQELDKLRNQFFANLSHEIKTPINIIFSGLQLIESKKKIDEEEVIECFYKYEPIIKQNCFRILRLTNNLVDMTKFDSGFMKMNFINVDIVRLVEDITMSVVDYVENKNINIIFDTLIEEKIIKCDKDSIERIVLNLISNSIKFTNENGNILVFMEMEKDYVVIRVKDDGIGIPKESRESIFNVFVQADKSLNRAKEGSGIGLSLVKAIVEKHEGTVECVDCDKGTEMVVKLPDRVLGKSVESQYDDMSYEKDIILKINTEFSDIYDLN